MTRLYDDAVKRSRISKNRGRPLEEVSRAFNIANLQFDCYWSKWKISQLSKKKATEVDEQERDKESEECVETNKNKLCDYNKLDNMMAFTHT